MSRPVEVKVIKATKVLCVLIPTNFRTEDAFLFYKAILLKPECLFDKPSATSIHTFLFSPLIYVIFIQAL
jgi:hypothetical protein